MDDSKCNALKAGLAEQSEPHIVPIEQFLDGNDDPGSIGCNLMDHPGMTIFRNVLLGLLERPDVQSIYVLISELDPGDGCWPFADTLFIAGPIPVGELRGILKPLQPDEVESGEVFGIPASLAQKYNGPVSAAWWD